MTDDQLKEWASKAASKIVKREGAALALSVNPFLAERVIAGQKLLTI